MTTRYALMGGGAVMLHGRRARTRDVDFIVALDEPQFDALLARAVERGLQAERKSSWHMRVRRDGAVYADVVLADAPILVDAVQSAVPRSFCGTMVPVISAEHLIALKVLAGRPRDLRDVADIVETQPALNVAKVQRLLADFDVEWTP